ncbi:group-specific protein [Bacillus thuringiensis MC28]|nr:group-specific protein [Bacillus thuringiensis MC28]
MKLTNEERTALTYELGDIIEQKCRRCYYNRSSNESFSVNECKMCPTGEKLRQLGRYLDIQPKKNGGPRKRVPVGLTPEIVRDLNQQGISDKEISIMYDRSFTYVGKLKKQWESEGKWTGATDMREMKRQKF